MRHSSLTFRTQYMEDLVKRRHEELKGNRQALDAWNQQAEMIRAYSKGSATEPQMSSETPAFGMSTGHFGNSTEAGDSTGLKLRASAPSLMIGGSTKSPTAAQGSQGFSLVRSTDDALAQLSVTAPPKPAVRSMKERMQALSETAETNAVEISKQRDFLKGYAALRMQSPEDPSVAETQMLTGNLEMAHTTAPEPSKKGTMCRRLHETEFAAVENSGNIRRLKQHFKTSNIRNTEADGMSRHDEEPSKVLSRAESLSRSRARESLMRCLH